MEDEFDIIALVYDSLESLNIPVIEGWYDKEINKTYITVHEYLDLEDGFEDDNPSEIEHNIQVDIWSKDGIEASKLKSKVRKLLKKNNFDYDDGQDQYETDTKIYHKGMRFSYTELL
ncbi:hypothetical protein P5F25_02590 [Clostridium perfringens]|nr:hypothetical protein [Clostridium perfringens]